MAKPKTEFVSVEESKKLVFDFKRTQILPQEWNNFCKRYAERSLESVMEWLEAFGENKLGGKKLDEEVVRDIFRMYVGY